MQKPDPPLQAEFEYIRFCLRKTAREIQEEFFPGLEVKPQVFFSMTKSAAYIVTAPKGNTVPYIVLNPIYNHPDTPEIVVRSILKHEFIHFIIRPREIDGMRTSHPPEFFELERKICPERAIEELYDTVNFGEGFYTLPADERNEARLLVRPLYVRRNRQKRRLSLEEIFGKFGDRDSAVRSASGFGVGS